MSCRVTHFEHEHVHASHEAACVRGTNIEDAEGVGFATGSGKLVRPGTYALLHLRCVQLTCGCSLRARTLVAQETFCTMEDLVQRFDLVGICSEPFRSAEIRDMPPGSSERRVDHGFKRLGVVCLEYQTDIRNVGESCSGSLRDDSPVRYSLCSTDLASPNAMSAPPCAICLRFVVPQIYRLVATS